MESCGAEEYQDGLERYFKSATGVTNILVDDLKNMSLGYWKVRSKNHTGFPIKCQFSISSRYIQGKWFIVHGKCDDVVKPAILNIDSYIFHSGNIHSHLFFHFKALTTFVKKTNSWFFNFCSFSLGNYGRHFRKHINKSKSYEAKVDLPNVAVMEYLPGTHLAVA